jgi:hypothetical protein
MNNERIANLGNNILYSTMKETGQIKLKARTLIGFPPRITRLWFRHLNCEIHQRCLRIMGVGDVSFMNY